LIRNIWLRRLRKLMGQRPYGDSRPTNQERFTRVFETGRWKVGASASGPGSERGSGSVLHSLEILEYAYGELGVRSIVDVPCGDFHWMPDFLERHPDVAYVGCDIVEALVLKNRQTHPGLRFELLDIVTQTPPLADLILCKDLACHLYERDVWAALENMAASGARYLAITSNAGEANAELQLLRPGACRPVDLATAPYDLPPPLRADHYMPIWDAAAIGAHLASRRAIGPISPA